MEGASLSGGKRRPRRAGPGGGRKDCALRGTAPFNPVLGKVAFRIGLADRSIARVDEA